MSEQSAWLGGPPIRCEKHRGIYDPCPWCERDAARAKIAELERFQYELQTDRKGLWNGWRESERKREEQAQEIERLRGSDSANKRYDDALKDIAKQRARAEEAERDLSEARKALVWLAHPKMPDGRPDWVAAEVRIAREDVNRAARKEGR